MFVKNSNNKILKIIEDFSARLPKFPDGRIDYTNSKESAVLNIFVEYAGKYLFMKRSGKVIAYKGKWSTVVGFLDEARPIEEKVLEELREEAGIKENMIKFISIGKIIRREDNKIDRVWIICPVFVKMKKMPKIILDWEHTEFKWISKEEIKSLDTLPNLEKVLESVDARNSEI